MHRGFIKTAAITGALTVALGAFAAHGLKNILPADLLAVFETAVKYQFYHVLALLATGILYASQSPAKLKWSGYLFITGMVLFCGSLYLLCYVKYNQINMEWIGAVTPFGGAAFIGGWIMLAAAYWKRN